ncbi:Catabolite control protein A [Pseudovibrio axinellae]|uniref:Catabolite control protein A n=1 Tax=Pseudovibrio axinellae TaxID=989403 RepID=A0A166BB72_9HYPH|nr:LacI family DNA-binding transcriptional regulator [Pseudovibrio axinellae]KZL22089.1 Catabolite control protein A [Pseudovibrio axinellae]SEQ55758.1 transcriptional regulator, LacI family [Pseudovibrio axinellae]
MPTIKDVAKKARVSVGTVSRVLSKNETVKHPLKLRVLEAMKALEYKPNLAARALRTNSIDIIGLVVPDITNPFFAELAKFIEMEAAKRHHSVMLANSHGSPEDERTQLVALLDRAVRGIILVATSNACVDVSAEVPIVALDRKLGAYPLVTADHFNGSREIAELLYSLGHRRIAYISGPLSTKVARDRKDGFLSKISDLNSSEDPITLTVYEGQFDFDSGNEIGRKILEGQPAEKRPTAIAAASDQQAIGVLRCAHDLKLDVPTDLSVSGFDDINLAALVIPSLTTVRQPIEALAAAAIHQIFNPTENGAENPIACSLIARESTRAL